MKAKLSSVARKATTIFLFFTAVLLQACGGPSNSDLSALTGVTGVDGTGIPTLVTTTVSFTPTTYDYGSLMVLSANASKAVTVTNTSTDTLYLGSVTGGNTHFTVTGNTCTGQALLAGGICQLTIKFAPQSGGPLSSLITIGYDTAPASSTLSVTLPLSGTGITGLTFNGVDLIDNIKTTSVRVNWTPAAGASGYDIFQVALDGTLNLLSPAPSATCAGSCSYTVSGLTPNTLYTYRVHAVDNSGMQDANTNDQSATTQTIGSFTALAGMSASENTLTQTPLLNCSDAYGNTPVYAIDSQTDTASNCIINAGRVKCTPSFKTGHASWTSDITVSCALNGSTFTRTFTAIVSDTNRAPVIALAPAADQTVVATAGTVSFNASGSSDADLDSITYSCTFSGGGFAAGTACTSLPASSYSFVAGTGAFSWLPSLAAAVGGFSTVYAVKITGNDGTTTGFSSLNITVVPGMNITINAITSTKVTFSWPNISGAQSFNVYQDGSASPIGALTTGACGGPTCSFTAVALTPNTAHTFNVIASNAGGVYSTSDTPSATTHALGTFAAISNLAVAEGASAQTANLDCHNSLSTTQNFSILSQSDVNTNCTLTAISGTTAKVLCSPSFKNGHAAWAAATVTVQCSMDDSTYSSVLTVNVSDTNRAPLLTVINSQSVNAGAAITTVDALDTNTSADTDIDTDPLLYSCVFSGGGFGAGTACASLPNTSYSFNTSTGTLDWTPSFAAAVGGATTIYTFTITGSDQQSTPLTSARSFPITVNSINPILTALTSKLYPANNAVQGVNVTYDVNNVAGGGAGNDTGMTYACVFDTTVDGSVSSGANCNTLPGFISFSTSTGILSWTPNASASGQYEIKFAGTNAAATGTTLVVVDVRLNFTGITSISNITGSSMQLNWSSNVSAAGGYNIYSVNGAGSLTLNQNVAGSGSTNAVISGLSAGTTYKWRVRAIDALGNLDNNTTDLAANTLGSTFGSIAGLAASENANAQTATLACSDVGMNTPAYTVMSQTDTDSTCTISSNKVSCTPLYKIGHAAWTSDVNIRCIINGSTLNQTFTVGVADTNRAPVLATINPQTITAGGGITAIDPTDTNSGSDTDIDTDTLAYTCTFGGGGFSAGTTCTLLPGTASFSPSTGILNWTSSASSAVANASTVYTVVIIASDQRPTPATDSKTFALTVNPGAPVLTSLTSKIFPANPAIRGTNVSYDVNNIAAGGAGNDTGMTYACTFDTTVDGAVAAGANCSTLPGFISFSTTTGALSWTPNGSAVGQYEIKFAGTNSGGTATSIVVADVRLNFAGITSVSSILTTAATLNWTAAAGAAGYFVYSVDGAGNLTLLQTISNGATVNATVTGLTASTTYTFRVRAYDSLGNSDPNLVNQNVTTKNLGTLSSIAPLSATENSASLTANLVCSDTYSSVPAYSITNQTDAAANCTITTSPEKVTCTPSFKTGHSTWTSDITVQCILNTSTLATKTFTVTVTDTNRAPQIALTPSTAQLIAAGSAMTAVDAADTNTTNDTDRDGDTLTYSCTFAGGGNSAGTACSSLPNLSFSFNTATGVLNWTPTLAAAVAGAATVYTFTIVGSDGQGTPLTGSTTLTVTVNPAVALTAITSKTFPSTYADQGSTVTYDVNNVAGGGGGNDTNMSYTCYYDQIVDGTVAATNLCTTLPGSATFSTVTGALSWTPDSTAYGPYELKFTGTNTSAVTDSKIVTVDVRSPYVTANLIGYWDAQFANGGSSQGINSSFTSSIKDLTTAATTNDGTLTNFGQTTSSGWTGNAARTISSASDGPYRMKFDGVNDYVSIGTGLNTNADTMIDGWARPASVSTGGATILSNADSAGKGIRIKQAYDGTGKLQAQIGLNNYDDVVVADGPKVYWRLNEPAGTSGAGSVKDSSGNNYTGTPEGVGLSFGNAVTPFAASNMTSFQPQSGATYIRQNDIYGATSTLLDSKTTASFESWVYFGSLTRNYGLIYWGDPATPANDFILTQNNNTLQLYVGGTTNSCQTGITMFSFSTWYHIAVTYDGSQAATLCARVKIYINGVSKPLTMTGTIPASIANNSGAAQVRVGYSLPVNGILNYDLGLSKMQEVAVYDKVLSPAQVAAHSNATMKGCLSSQAITNSTWSFLNSWYDNTNSIFSFSVNGQTACLLNGTTYTYSGSSSALTAGSGAAAVNPWAGEIGDTRLYSTGGSLQNSLTNYFNTGYRYGRPKEQINTNGLVMYLDAASALNNGPQTANTCSNANWAGVSSTPGFSAALTNFLNSDCIASTDGWQGDGSTGNPYQVKIDGVNDKIVFSPRTFTGDFTIVAWIKRAANGVLNYVFSDETNAGYFFTINAGATPTFSFTNAGGATNGTTTAIALNTWYQVSLTRSMTNTGAGCATAPCTAVFVNGVQAGNMWADPLAGAAVTFSNLGLRSSGTSSPVSSYAAAAMYSRVLSSAEILSMCNTLSSRFPSGQACAP